MMMHLVTLDPVANFVFLNRILDIRPPIVKQGDAPYLYNKKKPKTQSNLGRASSPNLTKAIPFVTVESPKLSPLKSAPSPSTITTRI